jgi:hypothetical protein
MEIVVTENNILHYFLGYFLLIKLSLLTYNDDCKNGIHKTSKDDIFISKIQAEIQTTIEKLLEFIKYFLPFLS